MNIPSDPSDFPQAFAAAWATREGAQVASLFTEDADFVNVTGLWWQGRAAISKPHDYALKSFFATSTLKPGRTTVRTLGPDHAVVRCRFTLTGQSTPDGRMAGPRQTILVFVLQRDGAVWRAVTAQNTDVMPGMETFVQTEGLHPVRYAPPSKS